MNIATSARFWGFLGKFSWKIIFPEPIFVLLSVSYRQQTPEFCFLIQPAILSLLIGDMRLLVFSVNIERYVVIPVILLFL
jgi:hypothetical protein